MKANWKAALSLCLTAAGISGCTTSRELVYDNTVQVAKQPVAGTLHLGIRVKTFWSEEVISLWRRSISFPVLSHREIPAVDPADDVMNHEIMARWLDKKTDSPCSGSVQLLLNGETFFPHFIDSIQNATNRIDLKTYIFDNDDVAEHIAELLKSRSEEVKIRILYDSLGTRAAWRVDSPSVPLSAEGGLGDMVDFIQDKSPIRMRRACHTLLTSEHSKFVIMDHFAYFGGMNIGREYRYDWRDAMFLLNGPVVDELSRHFETAWTLAKGDPLTLLKMAKSSSSPSDGGDLYLIATTPFDHALYKGQLRAIKKAKKQIYIENPYLWNQPILYQLCAARKRGVDVRVTVPRDINHEIGAGANRKAVQRLLQHGVRVFVYPGMTHVKAALYDQWVCFGSANFDDLSLHKNYELNMFTDNPETVRQVREELLVNGQQISKEIFDVKDSGLKDFVSSRLSQYL